MRWVQYTSIIWELKVYGRTVAQIEKTRSGLYIYYAFDHRASGHAKTLERAKELVERSFRKESDHED